MTKIMDGKALAAKLRAELKEKVAALKEGGKEIGLAVVLIGDDQASKVYVRNKIKGCEEVGIRSYSFNLPASASQRDAENLVKELVASDNIHGILVQLPLPSHLDEQAILKRGQSCHEPRDHRRMHALRRHETFRGVRRRSPRQERGRSRPLQYRGKTHGDAAFECGRDGDRLPQQDEESERSMRGCGYFGRCHR